jgi:ABC-2 type transport system permease protein
MFGMFMVQLLFLSVGSVLAAALRRPKIAPSLASGVLLATFFLSMGIDMSDKLDFLKYVTPFQYFAAKRLLSTGYDAVFLLLSILITAVLIVLTYLLFRKKDLSV